MELKALWQILRRRWWVFLLPVVVAFLLILPTLPDLLNPTSTYSVAMRFAAAAPADLPSESTYEDRSYVPWLASEYVVVNLPQWVTSDTFAQEVSAELGKNGLTISADEVRPAFVADSSRSILVVYITWDDRAEIEAIATAAVKVLQERNQTYFPQFAAYPAEIVALDAIRINETAPPITRLIAPLLRIGVALAAGIGLAAALEFLDNTVHSAEDVRALELDVIGIVPDNVS